MDTYCVNTQEDDEREHEVHNLTKGCEKLPAPPNRRMLGEHWTCTTAVRKAKAFFPTANGCWFCSRDCHNS